MDIKRLEGESLTDWKFRVLLAKSKKEIEHSWKDIHEELETGLSIDTVTKGTIFFPEFEKYIIKKYKLTQDEMPNYKESVTINKDGSQLSDKLVQLSEQEMKDEKAVLNAHGYNPSEWEITSAKNSMYHVNAKGGITKLLYSSKISVRKKENSFDIDKLVERLSKGFKVSELEYSNENGESMLVIPYFDMHFGIATLDTYKETLHKTIEKIKSKKWSKILLISGQDKLHNDGFTGQTTSGTIIDKVDMENAWKDAFIFDCTIIDESILNSNSVEVIFSAGNHDQAMGWALVKSLEVKYPQVDFNTDMKQFKAFRWENVFLGITHGDKANQQRAVKAFIAEYGNMMVDSKCREILTGHLHHTKTHDDFGIVYRTLGSGVPTDDYHADHAFVGAVKKFQLLEYDKDGITCINYV